MREGTHPVAAVIILSYLFGGWPGMFINRQPAKGALFLLFVPLMLVLACGGSPIYFVIPFWYIFSAVDATMVANRLNRGEPVRPWQFF